MTRLNASEHPMGTSRCYESRAVQIDAQTSWMHAGTSHTHLYTVYVIYVNLVEVKMKTYFKLEKKLLLIPYTP